MTQIVIRRCDLHIRRTSGWAWGASPDELIRSATRAIPQLLAARLPELAVPADASIVIERPVTVKITATARQLAALGDAAPGTPEIADLRARIEADVAAAVASAIERDGIALDHPGVVARVDEERKAAEAARDAELARADAPRRAVHAWWRAGDIDAVLARLEPVALARLHELLLSQESGTGDPLAAVLEVVERTMHAYPVAPVTPLECVRRRIAIAAAAIDAMPAVATAQLRAAIERVLPLDAKVATGVAASGRSAATPGAVARTSPVDVSGGAAHRDRTGELVVRSALPFLLLSSLRHAGWLDAATALLALHGCEADGFALAAGLAAKVVDPLERGWARSPADRLAISVFSGRTEPILDAEISAAATRLRPLLSSLDAGLRAVISRARGPAPVVVWRAAGGWRVLDGDGMVVLASGDKLGELLALTPPAPIVVPAQFAAGEVFEAIDYANRCFITDAPPGRTDPWRSFAGTTRRLFTNDTALPTGKLVAITAHLDHTLALAEELAEMLDDRPAIPRDSLSSFDSTCSLAATAALADISARLFPTEPTTPVLALTRFRDLDARVMFEDDRVRVRVPLGRRHADLMQHGVLGEFAGVPWWNGYTIDLGGG